MLILMPMTATMIGFGIVAALGAGMLFVLAKAKPVDVALAVVGYGGTYATIVAASGPYYGSFRYLVPLMGVFTAAWMLATVRLVQYRPIKWRWRRGESDRRQS